MMKLKELVLPKAKWQGGLQLISWRINIKTDEIYLEIGDKVWENQLLRRNENRIQKIMQNFCKIKQIGKIMSLKKY